PPAPLIPRPPTADPGRHSPGQPPNPREAGGRPAAFDGIWRMGLFKRVSTSRPA
ncbi:MAG: hypothetical protein QOF44_2891, partial [Streptomyces sp.]|nr:hypothetical protein [Streptomyces sp.]